MRSILKLHPDSRCDAVTRIEVEVARTRRTALALKYVVTGKIADLDIPPPGTSERVDGLWRHTCFEAFVRQPPGVAYSEFNLAPSTQWAAYHFGDYRTGMTAADDISAPRITIQSTPDELTLDAALTLSAALASGPIRLGLSAVVEEADGRISYWAVAHPPGKPDFHHSDCFALEL